MDNKADLYKFFEEGLGKNTYRAEYNYYVFKTIGMHTDELNEKATKFEAKHLKYLQNSGSDLAVLSLSKIYESKSEINTRSIWNLLNRLSKLEIKEINSAAYYPDLKLLKGYKGFRYDLDTTFTNADLITGIKSVLKKKKTPIKHLVDLVRNKYIAHSDHLNKVPGELDSFWLEFLELLTLARLLRTCISYHFFGTNFPLSKTNEEEFSMNIIIEFHWLQEIFNNITTKKAG